VLKKKKQKKLVTSNQSLPKKTKKKTKITRNPGVHTGSIITGDTITISGIISPASPSPSASSSPAPLF
jgi:type V secretory pathway adhesin AidA